MTRTPYDTTATFVEVDGVRLHCRLDGDPRKPTLALINMASHNLHSWEPVVPALQDSFQLLRFDIRGTGKSQAQQNSTYSFTRYADDLLALLDHFAIDQALVLGVAYGARTAARFALAHPERLSALCLADVSLTPPVAQDGQRALAAEARQLLQSAGTPAPEPQKYWRFYEDRDTAYQAHTAHEQEPDLTPALAAVHQPTLVLCGRQDMNLSQAQRIASALPQGQLEIMEMTGHGSPLFRPQRFAAAVTSFAAAQRLLNS